MSASRRWRSVSGALMVLGLAVGCSSQPPPQPPPNDMDKQMMTLVSLYSTYRSKHGGKAPVTVAELKKWVKTLKPDDLAKMDATDVDRLFTSPRDNQEFAMTKPRNDMAAKMGAQGLIFYEREGVNGKHMTVAGMGARPTEIDRETLKQRVPEFGP